MKACLLFVQTCFHMNVGPSKDASIRSVVVDSFGNNLKLSDFSWKMDRYVYKRMGI